MTLHFRLDTIRTCWFASIAPALPIIVIRLGMPFQFRCEVSETQGEDDKPAAAESAGQSSSLPGEAHDGRCYIVVSMQRSDLMLVSDRNLGEGRYRENKRIRRTIGMLESNSVQGLDRD